MSRFALSAAAQDGQFHFRAGNTLADSLANAQPGDRISAVLCAKPFAGMIPLDAAAVSALAAQGITTTIGTLIIPITGAASVDP